MSRPRSRRRVRELIQAIEDGRWSPTPFWLSGREVMSLCLRWADGQRVPMVAERLKEAKKLRRAQ